MTTARYEIGDMPLLSFSFVSTAGVPADPATAILTLTPPNGGTPLTADLTSESVARTRVGEWTWQISDPFDVLGMWLLDADPPAGILGHPTIGIAVELSPAEQAAAAAESLLWALSGRRYGFRSVVESYITVPRDQTRGTNPLSFSTLPDTWNRRDNCNRLILRHSPVQTIESVTVEGSPVTEWRLEAGTLVLPDDCMVTDPYGAFAVDVSYTWGMPWDALGTAAIQELTNEFLLGINGETCRISTRAVSITRKGVTVELDDASALIGLGLTGLPLCDAFIRTVNPNRLSQPSRVYSPDIGMAVR
jgi:hypothetical protein